MTDESPKPGAAKGKRMAHDAYMNHVVLIGRARDIKVLDIVPKSGGPTIKRLAFVIGVRKPPTFMYSEYYWVQCWKGLAVRLEKHLTTNTLVAVHGRLEAANFKNKFGNWVKTVRVRADSVQFLRKPKGEEIPDVVPEAIDDLEFDDDLIDDAADASAEEFGGSE